MLLATAAVVVLGLTPELTLAPGLYERADGAMLLLLFCVFLYTAVGDVLHKRPQDPVVEQALEACAGPAPTLESLQAADEEARRHAEQTLATLSPTA